jgi:hypothetical protein
MIRSPVDFSGQRWLCAVAVRFLQTMISNHARLARLASNRHLLRARSF